MKENQVSNDVNYRLTNINFDKRKLLDEAKKLKDFDSIAGYYGSKLYPKEKRVARARKFVREFDTKYWNGTLIQLLDSLYSKIKFEAIAISPDDLIQAIEDEGLMI